MRSLEHCGPSLDGLTESTSSMRSRWIRILLREIFRNLVPGVAAQFNPGPGFRVMNGAPGPLLAAAFPRRASGSESKAPPDSEAACHWQWARAAPAGRPRARSRPESGVTRRPGPHAISVQCPPRRQLATSHRGLAPRIRVRGLGLAAPPQVGATVPAVLPGH